MLLRVRWGGASMLLLCTAAAPEWAHRVCGTVKISGAETTNTGNQSAANEYCVMLVKENMVLFACVACRPRYSHLPLT